jgi:hypothetical protein
MSEMSKERNEILAYMGEVNKAIAGLKDNQALMSETIKKHTEALSILTNTVKIIGRRGLSGGLKC